MQDELWSSRSFFIEEQGLPDKLAAQIAKEIDMEYAQELCALSREEMENRLAESLVETERAKREVQNNESYKKAKEDVKYFEDALKDKVNPLKAVAALMLFKLDNAVESAE
jgi:esterase/lipase